VCICMCLCVSYYVSYLCALSKNVEHLEKELGVKNQELIDVNAKLSAAATEKIAMDAEIKVCVYICVYV
jgi:hypothetical protein